MDEAMEYRKEKLGYLISQIVVITGIVMMFSAVFMPTPLRMLGVIIVGFATSMLGNRWCAKTNGFK